MSDTDLAHYEAPLAPAELADLEKHNAAIRAGKTVYLAVGTALKAVRDGRLYRATHKTFEAWCQEVHGFTRQNADYQILAAATHAELADDKHVCQDLMPENARQAVAISRAPAEDRPEVLRAAADLPGGLTTKNIESVIAERRVAQATESDGGLMAYAMPELLEDEPAGDRQADGTPIVRRNDPALIRELFSPGAVAAAHKQMRAEKEQGRREERAQRIEAIAQGARPLHFDQAFPVIYADPPWRYEFVSDSADAIENHYPTMSTEEICALPVADVATPDAILFLWTTSPKLLEGLQVVEAWGFTYRTQMVWHKSGMGMGYWARQDHEILLIATRGSVPTPAPADRPSSVQAAPKGAHSEKPALFAELIERMFPAFSKLEMFCRAPRDGWTAWGNQVDAEAVA